MKKILLLFAAMTLSAGLWADTQNVLYLYPVYNTDGDAASGIKEWESATVEAIVVTEYITTLYGGWYVVSGSNVQTGTLVCNGAVHLILADGAKLTTTATEYFTPGIQVSGEGNSLTIYAQSTGEQSGELEVYGKVKAAGIGGGNEQNGSNITIHGGRVTVTGGVQGAGIGGGFKGSGSNIIINGGEVNAGSQMESAGIGGGAEGGSGSDIIINGGKVEVSGDAAGIGGGNGGNGFNITINGGEVNAVGIIKSAGIGGGSGGNGYNIAIHGGTITAIGGHNLVDSGAAGIGGGSYGVGSYITITDGVVTTIGGTGASGIGNGANAGGSQNIIVATRCIVKAGDTENPTNVIENDGTDLASKLNGKRFVTTIDELTNAYIVGYERGKAEAFGEMGTECDDCPAVEVIKGEKTIILYGPEKVNFKKMDE